MTLVLRFAALSDVGRVRRDNQDSGYAGPHLLAVADGVGGAARGDIASTAAIQQLRGLDQPPGNDALEQLAGAVHLAHNRIADLVSESPELDGTSTTTTAALFDGSRLNLAHVGDSRGYLLRDGVLRQLTKDHTFVQSLVDEGRITEDEARVHPHRNLILRAVDGVHEPDPDVEAIDVQPGDRVLLCSDGCCGVLDDATIADLLGHGSLESAATALVTASLDAGSSDNVTVVLAEAHEIDPDDTTEASAPVVVGAAAGDGRGPAWGLRRRKVEDDGVVVDPEAVRYAPLPPPRFVWGRRLALLGLVVLLVAAAAFAGYRYTQSRYYVGAAGGKVAIYRGVDWQVPLVDLDHVLTVSSLPISALGDYDGSQVRDGIPVSSLAAARAKVAALRARACANQAASSSGSTGTGSGTKSKSKSGTTTNKKTTGKSGSKSGSSKKKSSGTKKSASTPTATPSPQPPAVSGCGS